MDGSGLQHTSMEIRKLLRAEEMFFLKVFADNPDDPSSVLRTHKWKERTDS